LKRAEADLRHNQDSLRHADRDLARAHTARQVSQERHWGRRDKNTITRAESDLGAATRNREVLVQKVAQSKALAEHERNKVREWEAATRNTAATRDSLTKAIHDLDTALAAARPDRVATATIDPNNELWASIGPPPTTRGGIAASFGIAERVEADRERGQPNLGARRMTDDLGTVLGHAQIIDAASQQDPTTTPGSPVDPSLWQPALAAGSRLITEPTQQTLEQDVGLEL
jgi:hypothetical protein